MIFIHCAGNGDLYTTDGTAGSEHVEHGRGDAGFMAACNAGATAWFSQRDASDFYFYDFTGWGFATTSVTVPVGRHGERVVFNKPAHRLTR
jgi:hypothetical protein